MTPSPPPHTSPSRRDLQRLPIIPGESKDDSGSVGGGSGTENDSGSATFYELVGGEATFRRLVSVFYGLVAHDEVLRPMYPEEDLTGAEERLVLFLMQFWGGPRTYAETRGHPRLRMRHAPFVIGPVERDAWLANMRAALDTLALEEAHDVTLWDYLVRAAFSMQNSYPEEGAPGAP